MGIKRLAGFLTALLTAGSLAACRQAPDVSQVPSSVASQPQAPSSEKSGMQTIWDIGTTETTGMTGASTSATTKTASRVTATLPTTSVTASPTTTTATEAPQVREYYSSAVGMWYCVWWDSEEKDAFYFNHHWEKETRIKPVKFGYYATDDEAKLEYDFKMFKRWGIDYLILDDTNNHNADGGNIAQHIDACFMMARQLGEEAPKLNFAGGRPLIDGNVSGMQAELDIFAAYAAGYRDNTFFWKGKPLFVNFNIPKNYGYQDAEGRFTMRPAAGHVSEGWAYQYKYGINETGMYGWVFDVQYEDSEIHGISPGFSRSHNGLGTTVPPISRENGDRYRNEWLAAVKRKPEMIVISSWNDHAEETGIEAVELLEPIEGRGEEDPFFYEKITEGYLALKTGYLDGFCYRSESDPQMYRYDAASNKLVKTSGVDAHDPYIIVPDDYYDWAQVPRT